MRYEVDEDGKILYQCPKCSVGKLRWIQVGRFACRNEACSLVMNVFHTEGCHVADWDYLAGSDGEIYWDMDGCGPEAYTGSSDPLADIECAKRMRARGVTEDLIQKFLKIYKNPFRKSEDES